MTARCFTRQCAATPRSPEFCDLVEKLCPAPRYADLFSRYRHSEKWDCHGDEAPQAVLKTRGRTAL
jgi:N6-adenosine-specific RNA methylase IME4